MSTAYTPSSIRVESESATNLIARQPIINASQGVVAYELFDRSRAQNQHDSASDISLIFNAMNHAGHELQAGNMAIFINRTHASLSAAQLDLVHPEKVVLEIGPVAGHEKLTIDALQPTLEALRRRGFRLAFNHTVIAPAYAAWQPLADFVKLDILALKPEQLKPVVAAVQSRTTAKIVAEKIETQAQFNTMVTLGASFFQGYWVAHPVVVKTKIASPAQANVLQLFNLVRKEADTHEIEQVLKRDAMLGFNLLRLINSAGFGASQEVTSFRQAVMLMGLKRLFRWTALLLTASRANGSSAVVGVTAAVRGRMMELLGAGTLTSEECDYAFLVGIFSRLDDMLAMPMEQALDLLTLPLETREALLYGKGKYGRMLALTKACEDNDDAMFAVAALELQFSNHHINIAHMEALVWADNLAL